MVVSACVLNLVISGIPSILIVLSACTLAAALVLNLVISGIPSILRETKASTRENIEF